MSSFNFFKASKNKLYKIWLATEENRIKAEKLEKKQITELSKTTIKKTTEIDLGFKTIYYDLYDWKGITSQYGGSAPTPESAYHKSFDRNNWFFKYPTYNFRVLQGEKPWNVVAGTSPGQWEYQSTIGNVKQTYHFDLFPDWAIPYAKLKSYAYSENNAGTPVLVDDLYTFHRWIKKEPGYDFEFYGIFTMPEEQQLFLYVSLVMMNRRVMNVIQNKKI